MDALAEKWERDVKLIVESATRNAGEQDNRVALPYAVGRSYPTHYRNSVMRMAARNLRADGVDVSFEWEEE